jgi:L-cystine uptake protein TcyP (sodium:dicarboxylate symporter family)
MGDQGPATKIMTDLGIAITQNGLAGYYDGLIEYCTAERPMLNSLMFGHVMTTVLVLLPIDRSTIVSRHLLARPTPIG